MMTFHKICKTIVSFVLLTAALLTFCTLVVLAGKPDFRYRIEESLRGAETNLLHDVTDELPAMTQVAAGSLTELSNCTVEQSGMLINEWHHLPQGFEAQVDEYRFSGVYMNTSIIKAFGLLQDAVLKNCNKKLYVSSAYRTEEEQLSLIQTQGDTAAALGASEHQAGLALDIYTQFFAGEAFNKSEAGIYVSRNLWRYGFIVRYPADKTEITGIPYEPWHIRYVGLPHSEIMYRQKITLEEYYDSLPYGKFYSFGNYLISRQQGDTVSIPAQYENVTVSPDNMGGWLITVSGWKSKTA